MLNNKARKVYSKDDINIRRRTFFLDPPTSSAQYMIGDRAKSCENSLGFIHSEYPNRTYRCSEKIGDGSASKLYKGVVVNLQKNSERSKIKNGDKVIIKRISKNEEWRSELNVLKELQNTSTKILNLVDFYESDRFAYIITEFYDGFDLFEHIDINVPYPELYGKKLIKEMALCIKECHDRKVAHLDIKCENYMVVNMYPPKLVLIDFGHAEKISSKIMKHGNNYGTCFYICPEGHAKFYSMKSDIWSLGICAHLILTSDYPFPGYDDNEYMKNVCLGNVHISKKLNESAKDLINKCLDYNPKSRIGIEDVLEHPFFNN